MTRFTAVWVAGVSLVMGCASFQFSRPSQKTLARNISAQEPDFCQELPRPYFSDLKRLDIPNEWYNAYDLGDGIYAIQEPRHVEEVLAYLILGSQRAVLFDSGTGIASIKPMVSRIAGKLPVTVVLSHAHFDHVGSASQFPEIYAHETAFTRSREPGLKSEDSAWEATQICGALPSGFDPSAYSFAAFHVTHALRDLERIDLGGRVLEVIFTPGHTSDSICLLDSKSKTLFTGDTFYPGHIYLHLDASSVDDYEKSLGTLIDIVRTEHVTQLLGGHNRPASPVTDLIDVRDKLARIRRGEIQPNEKNTEDEYLRYSFGEFGFKMPLPKH